MKKLCAVVVTGIFLVLVSNRAYSQNAYSPVKASSIKPYHLTITFYKTTNLVFPYSIKSVDRGSRDILVQKAKAVENVLQIKAGRPDFQETNLTVITADGRLYSYVIKYADNPAMLTIQFANNTAIVKPAALFSTAGMNEATIQANAEKVAGENGNGRGPKDKKFGMGLKLNDMYIGDDVMFCQFKLKNRSNISYDIEQIRFFIRDQKNNKRTATQELEIKPLYVYGNPSTVAGQSERIFVFSLAKFTIPDKKYLAVQFMEKSGGRHLSLKIHNKRLVRSETLPSL
jgi:conjugative transposon TraN protein